MTDIRKEVTRALHGLDSTIMRVEAQADAVRAAAWALVRQVEKERDAARDEAKALKLWCGNLERAEVERIRDMGYLQAKVDRFANNIMKEMP